MCDEEVWGAVYVHVDHVFSRVEFKTPVLPLQLFVLALYAEALSCWNKFGSISSS